MNQTNLFHLGRQVGLDGGDISDNPIPESDAEKYIWWHEGFEFGREEREELNDQSSA
jgi:hypothetical protein